MISARKTLATSQTAYCIKWYVRILAANTLLNRVECGFGRGPCVSSYCLSIGQEERRETSDDVFKGNSIIYKKEKKIQRIISCRPF